jgi:predicted dehydrogenase
MNFGIIGSGYISEIHARAIQAIPGCRVLGVYGTNPEKTAGLAAATGAVPHATLDALLATPNLEIVTIATPSGAHLEPALAAARAGKHVICEKPLEVTTARANAMIHTCNTAGVVLTGIFNRRFHPAVQHLRQAVVNGRFGQLVSASATVKWWRSQAYYDSAIWRGTWALDGGGVLMNQAIHTIDQLLWLAGPVTAVHASVACLAHHDIEVEDTAVALLEFASGARGVIEGSTACWSSTGLPAEVQLCGTRGTVVLTDERFRVWDFAAPAPQDEEIRASLLACGVTRGLGANDPKAIHALGHQRCFEDAITAIRAGRPPLVDGPEARKAVTLIEAIYQSAREGGSRIKVA